MNDSTTTALIAAKLVNFTANADGYAKSIGSVNSTRLVNNTTKVVPAGQYANRSIGSLAPEKLTPTEVALMNAMGKTSAGISQTPIKGADPRWKQDTVVNETGEPAPGETSVETALNTAMDSPSPAPQVSDDMRDTNDMRNTGGSTPQPQSFLAKNKVPLLIGVAVAAVIAYLLFKK